MRPHAVVFDLWQTLAKWPDEDARELRRRWSEGLGVPVERFEELWSDPDFYRLRESVPIREVLAHVQSTLGGDGNVEEVLRWRLDLTRRSLVPVAGAVDALTELRESGVRVGLISNCTEEVALVWDATPLAPLIDVAVFSATAGAVKPEARIYELACEALGVDARDCLFVGDGANDELAGAARAGLTPVLIHPPGEDPVWDGLASWDGLRITSIPQVLDLLG